MIGGRRRRRAKPKGRTDKGELERGFDWGEIESRQEEEKEIGESGNEGLGFSREMERGSETAKEQRERKREGTLPEREAMEEMREAMKEARERVSGKVGWVLSGEMEKKREDAMEERQRKKEVLRELAVN